MRNIETRKKERKSERITESMKQPNNHTLSKQKAVKNILCNTDKSVLIYSIYTYIYFTQY